MTSLALYINELCDIITFYTACFMYTNIIRTLFLTFLMISLRLQVVGTIITLDLHLNPLSLFKTFVRIMENLSFEFIWFQTET